MSGIPEQTAQSEVSVQAPEAVKFCLLLGQMLFNFGATARRIHDSLAYLARHLGCRVDILVSYDALLITVHDGATYRTRVDSSPRLAGLNLLGLVRLSFWLRGLTGSQIIGRDLEPALRAIRDTPPTHSAALQALAAGCAGMAFCILNGGDPSSWGCSFIAAVFIFAIRRPLATRGFNIHLTNFLIALAGGFLAVLLARLTRTATPLIALVGPVLFLVPGVPMINGGIDIVRNHVTLGLARVGFTLAVVIDLCLGLGFTMCLVPSQISPPFSLAGAGDIVLVSSAGALAAGALGCLNNGSLPMMALCALGGLTGRLVRALAALGGLDVITASLIGVFCSTLVAGFIAERLRWPAVVVSVIAALPMVPGYFAIAGMQALLTFAAANTADPMQLTTAIQALTRAVFISVALVVGVIGPVIIVQRNKERI